MSEGKGLPAWAWVGCGCLGAVAAFVLLIVGIGVWGVHKARQLGEEMANPAERAEKVLDVLQAREIPKGYYPVVAFSVPFLFDVAMLTDRAPDESGHPPELGERGFIYMSFPAIGQQDQELRDFFEGKTDNVEALKRQRLDVDLDERVASGKLSREADALLWVSHRGSVHSEGDPEKSRGGLVTLFLIDCGEKSRRRLGVWFGPDPAPLAPAAELDLHGTVGDPTALEAFMEPIRPCG